MGDHERPCESVELMTRASTGTAQLLVAGSGTVVSVRAIASARIRLARALALEALPTSNRTAAIPWGTCLWVRPNEWLVTGTANSRFAIIEMVKAAIGRDDGAVVDISASRVKLELSGAGAREVLASCCPLDLHLRSFAVGHCAQSLIAKAPVLLHLVEQSPRWHLYVRPSLVAYVVAWLMDAMPSLLSRFKAHQG